MVMMYLLFLISLVFCRFFAGYDSRYQNGKYVVVSNPKLRMLLMDEMSFFDRKKRPEKDRNRMTVSGLVLYIYSLVTLILSVLLNFVVPKTPVEPWKIEADNFIMYADTLNEKLSAICLWIFFLAIISCTAILMVRYTKTEKQRWIKILTYTTAAIMLVAVAFVLYLVIGEFVSSFI